MATTKDVTVGFVVHDGIWLGGLNYLANLIAGLRLMPESRVTPVLLTGTHPDCLQQRFSGLPILRTPLLDRKSLPWVARKAAATLLAHDRLLQDFLEQNGISVLSHSGHLGRRGSLPTIGWIPDLQHLHLPAFFTAKQLRDRNYGYRELCNTCTRVVVSSHNSLRDLHRFAPASRAKADVLSFVAVPPASDGHHTLREMQQLYHFDSPFFLLPNQFWAHKNHKVVISALAESKRKGQRPLVLATGQTRDLQHPTHFSDLMQSAETAGVLDCFRVLGAIPSRHLAVLMEHAIALINPSLFEGWSTSVEEAKSMGKQILLSDIAVHQEQAPARGIFFAPDDASGLSAALESTQRDYDPEFEAEMRQEARMQLPARLKNYATQYSQIVGRALSPQVRAPGWLQMLARKTDM